MAIIEISTVIDTIIPMAIESITKNLDRSETVLRTLQRLKIDKQPASNDFETIYVYALVEYGVFKPKAILNFFRNTYIREAFRQSLYENDPDILAKEAEGIKAWNEETRQLGQLNHDIHRELTEFKSTFKQIVNLARTPSEAEQSHKIDELHHIIVDIQKRVKSLSEESSTAQQIARDRPEYWEFLLTMELIRPRISVLRREFSDLKRGLIFRPSRTLEGYEFTNWAKQKMQDLIAIINLLNTASTEELMASWGEPGQPGDVFEIKRAVDKIAFGCNALLDWEIDLHFTDFPPEFDNIKQKLEGWAENYLAEIERIPSEIGKVISQPNPQGTHQIDLVFEAPVNANEVIIEIERLAITLE